MELNLPHEVALLETLSLQDMWTQYRFGHVDGRTISVLVPNDAEFTESENMAEFLRIWSSMGEE